ncbi:MAG TPA: peptidylprolyl isomerase [Thermoanaerobaculia bacterium]|nr:peptidylprolyl isomerase [Thermoanaerobaculia bacterium]
MKKTILTLCLGLMAFSLLAQEAPATGASDPIIMKAGTTEVRKSEFEAALNTLPAEYQSYASGPGKRAFAEDFLRMRMLADLAEKEGIGSDPKVQSQLRLLRANTLANAKLEKMRSSVQIGDAELRAEYEAAKPALERAQASHILIAFEGSPAAPETGALTDEAAKAKAEQIRVKVANGADFAELAKSESHDKASGAQGGTLGEFARGQMVPEFEKAVFDGKPGDLVVVRTQFGYHIIRVESKSTLDFEQIKPQLEEQARQKKLEGMIDSMQGSANFDDSYFGPAAPAIDAPGGSN